MNDTKNEREELTHVILNNPYEKNGERLERYAGSYYTRHEKNGLAQKVENAVTVGIVLGYLGFGIASLATENKTVDDIFLVFTFGLSLGVAYEAGKNKGESRYKKAYRSESLERELLKLK